MSDGLRESPNRDVYETLMQQVLTDDETKRDLLVGPDEPDEERQALRRREQVDAAAQELTDVVHRLRAQAVDVRLARLTADLAAAGAADGSAKEEVARLVAERDRLRRG